MIRELSCPLCGKRLHNMSKSEGPSCFYCSDCGLNIDCYHSEVWVILYSGTPVGWWHNSLYFTNSMELERFYRELLEHELMGEEDCSSVVFKRVPFDSLADPINATNLTIKRNGDDYRLEEIL